jgi:hypothetical protein
MGNYYRVQINNAIAETVDFAFDNNGNQLTVTKTPYIDEEPQTRFGKRLVRHNSIMVE